MPITDELRKSLAVSVGLNWDNVQTSLREAAFPQPPYKEPLMYLIYLLPEIPWRQCERVSSRLLYQDAFPGTEEALHLAEDLMKAYMAHRPYHL